ncbi:DUF3617 family protein [Hyphomicrobium sp. CS1GBMeth3]|uniref:DUF3617 domain-containing protein n=1 Tax=Hyphomicrobium sp. CS1GBMeth3 TaxID=1892845 RepID=UPI000B03AB01|nr:DUF3617 family protein [Hyphomicrobium sp. CS1GBMeth3]
MRSGAMGRAVAVIAGVLALDGPALADEASLPERKAGLWELHTVMDEGLGPKDQTLKMCVDAEMEHNTVKASSVEHANQCTKYEVKREGEKTVVDMSCQFASRHVKSRTEMTGDFKSALLVKIDSTTSGDHNGQTVAVKRTITQIGKYLGESCGELVGGEAMGSDGSRVMVQ